MRLETGQVTDGIAFLDNGLLDASGVGSTYVLRGDESRSWRPARRAARPMCWQASAL